MNAEEPMQMSLLTWMVNSLGTTYLILLPAAALLSIVLALVVVIRGRGSMAAAMLLLIVPLPLLVGFYASLHGAIMSFQILASGSSAPKPTDVAMAFSVALMPPFVGLLMMVPAYTVATIGTFVRSLTDKTANGE
ncbi:hypothetical protein [Aporhodopirellula aestuarii]|uniref:Uncharacterized protein n=1 Tax=Aporhodopirellula aestuarii TaxID=2950107 RepID=A0ABT0UCM0_9BACT|nr:hypothetical protein [Aporhodopirellula aestuarii]MCM2374596.1 hypothetical protein [Aporhodopirellula aestuarii]